MKHALICLAAAAALPGCALFGGKDVSKSELPTQERIRLGFMDLGASEGKSACFAESLARRLDDERLERAAEIVESSEGSGDMRSSVLGAGTDLKAAFTGANFSCTLVR